MVLVLSGTACVLFAVRNTRRPAQARPKTRNLTRWAARRKKPAPESMPQLIRQLASLLAAGRTGPALWQAMAHVRVMELDRAPDAGEAAGRSAAFGVRPQPGAGGGFRAGGAVIRAGNPAPDASLTLVISVQRASAMGLSSAAAIRAACHAAPNRTVNSSAGPAVMTGEQQRMWLDIAACFAVCEASGAPVAAVLQRLATTLEADHDAAAQRETALAGPRATVRLLTWLPAVGLGLGILMGVDPLAALFGSPLGWVVLVGGLGFAVAGRFWSARLIQSAAKSTTNSVRSGS